MERVLYKYDYEYWTCLQSFCKCFARLGFEVVPIQIQRRDTRIHLPQNTAKKGKSRSDIENGQVYLERFGNRFATLGAEMVPM